MGDGRVDLLITFLTLISHIFDFFTLPIYFLLQHPWRNRALSKRLKAKPISSSEYEITYRSVDAPKEFHLKLITNNVDTLEKMFKYATKCNTTKKCIGTRQILGEESETQRDGRVFKKYKLGEYQWLNFIETENKAKQFGRAIREIGVNPKSRVLIFAETRAEWMISAHGLFKQSCTIVTIYATLGDDGVTHGINETEVDTIVTSHELLPKIRKSLNRLTRVKNVIYFEDQLQKTDTSGFDAINIYSFREMLEMGAKSSIEDVPPKTDDIAIIMYTSGSTGVPKGVLLSHRNVMTSLRCASDNFTSKPDDIYVGFLPLAHVLELIGESVSSVFGIPIGYSSAMTFLDASPKIMKGCKGDVSVLKPTCMPSVPLILDRIVKGINDRVNSGGFLLQGAFTFAYDYKVKWTRQGYGTPILDRILFKKVSKILGGRLRMIVCGGAPLSPETHEKVKLCLCTEILQGYGLTETTGVATTMDRADLTFGHVGAPLIACDIRLENWDEGNYRVTNKPNPQGELIIGGDNIAQGYFKLPEKTVENFFVEDGKRWHRTGDIGEFRADGTIKIIDRKKDLVKLQQGEYVSLGKIESELKTSPLVDNICVFANPEHNYCVALIVPTENALRTLASSIGVEGDLRNLCKDREVEKLVLKEISVHAKMCQLHKFEIPGAVTLCEDAWTPDVGLVTAAFKIKRKEIQDKYRNDIQRMYKYV